MKRIDAIIPEKNLDAVNKSLHGIGVTGVTVFTASGRGKHPPDANQMGYWLYYPRFGDNKVIMVLTSDADAEKTVQCISDSAEAGKVMITNVENLVDIRKKSKGEEAL
ncbi:MAG: P-II family nitrogen regulator [Nitrosopumilus sp.]